MYMSRHGNVRATDDGKVAVMDTTTMETMNTIGESWYLESTWKSFLIIILMHSSELLIWNPEFWGTAVE